MNHDMLIYNAIDSVVTHECIAPIWKDLEDSGNMPLYAFTEKLFQPLLYMALRGIAVDMEALKVVQRETGEEIIRLQQELHVMAGRDLNPLSPKDCIKYFYIERDISPYTNRKTGKPTTDDLAMQRLAKGTAARKPIPEAKLVQRLRGLHKLKGTYLDIEFDDDGRMRCSVNPRGTKTGRISTSKTIFNTGMNMQNLPEAFKKFLVADPGYVLIELDKAGAEWVVVAYLANDANMIKVVEEGLDPHAYTAQLMFKQPIDLIKEENKLIGHNTDPDAIKLLRMKNMPELLDLPFLTRNMSMRQAGKKANHGLNYDEGFRTFALMNELIESDAKKIIALYHEAYPGVRGVFHEYVKHQLSKDRTLCNTFGFRRKFLEAWNDSLFKAAFAQIPQSTVGQIVNWALINTYEDTNDAVQKAELLMQVHDSILLQYPIADLPLLPQALGTIIEYLNPTLRYSGRDFHIKTDAKIGYNWKDMTEFDHASCSESTLRSLIDGLGQRTN